MIKKIIYLPLLLALVLFTPAHALTKLLYALRDSDVNLQDHYRVLKDINHHHQDINILVPQSYVVDPAGYVYKFVNPELAKITKKYSIKLMPLVTNEAFDAQGVTQFLNDTKAQDAVIKTLTNLCKKNDYYGLQIDFEHVPAGNRDALTRFYTHLANALHAISCKISIAIIPARHVIPPSALLLKRTLYWTGAYDQKALGKVGDFVVLMTYNQNGGATTPGPTASIPLDEEAIKYALRSIPREKIFLGVPTASLYWRMMAGNKAPQFPSNQSDLPIFSNGIGISYQQVETLKQARHLKWQWDHYAKVHYAVFPYQDFYNYIFVSDAASVAAQKKLAEQYELGGIAIFRLGNEDPGMWQVLSSNQ